MAQDGVPLRLTLKAPDSTTTADGFGRADIIGGIAVLAVAAAGVVWLLGDVLYDALQRDGAVRTVRWVGVAVGFLVGLVVNEYAHRRFQARGWDKSASGLAILLAIGVFLAVYGLVVLGAGVLTR